MGQAWLVQLGDRLWCMVARIVDLVLRFQFRSITFSPRWKGIIFLQLYHRNNSLSLLELVRSFWMSMRSSPWRLVHYQILTTWRTHHWKSLNFPQRLLWHCSTLVLQWPMIYQCRLWWLHFLSHSLRKQLTQPWLSCKVDDFHSWQLEVQYLCIIMACLCYARMDE